MQNVIHFRERILSIGSSVFIQIEFRERYSFPKLDIFALFGQIGEKFQLCFYEQQVNVKVAFKLILA